MPWHLRALQDKTSPQWTLFPLFPNGLSPVCHQDSGAKESQEDKDIAKEGAITTTGLGTGYITINPVVLLSLNLLKCC